MTKFSLFWIFLILAIFLASSDACWSKRNDDDGDVDDGDVDDVDDVDDKSSSTDKSDEEPDSCSNFAACGLCGQNISVTIMLKNYIQEPYFEFSTNVESYPERELIYFMQQAAMKDTRFRFRGTYYGAMGYFIDTLNSLSSSSENKTFWNLLEHPSGNAMSVGVSTYLPAHEETVIFNFTTWA